MRRPQWVFIIASLMLVLACTWLWCSRRDQEPVHQGKTVSEWFVEFRKARDRHWTTFEYLGPAGRTTARTSDNFGLLHDPVTDGLRALGTNAVPYLADQVRRGDPWVWRVSWKLYGKLPVALRKVVPHPPVPRDQIRQDAALALTALGKDATSAVPALVEGLKTAGPFCQQSLLNALRVLPYESSQLDPTLDYLWAQGHYTEASRIVGHLRIRTPAAARVLLAGLASTNALMRKDCALELQHFSSCAPIVVPGLAAALKGTDGDVRRMAGRALDQFGPRAAPALPALVEALRSDDEEVRYLAARAIERIGPAAHPALPALMQATNDSSSMVQRVAGRTLEQLLTTSVPPPN